VKKLRKISRRSFLGTVAGGAVGIGAIAVVGTEAAGAATVLDPARSSDRDPSDPPAHNDSDPVNRNRRPCTDNDRGRRADPPGRGRRCRTPQPRTCSDSDTGRSDPARGSNSDTDRGVRDPVGRGRNCR
jgi:hypothetical protein